MSKIQIGSVISGTMRKEDLIPCFVDEILWYDKNNELALEINPRSELEGYYNSDDSNYDLESLFDELNNICDLPYFYFGSHPGDGSDYGFWLSEFMESDFEGLKVSDTSDVPENYNGEVLHVNDHGNTTLYDAINGKLTEVWAIV